MKNDQEMRQEALERMELLGLHPGVQKWFCEEGKLFYSQSFETLVGILFNTNLRPEWLEKIREVEEKSGILVYHCVHYEAEWGEVLDCLYVSAEKDGWEQDREDIKEEGIVPIYAFNLTTPEFSEFGSGKYRAVFGGLTKLA